jgi:hypothetical protein
MIVVCRHVCLASIAVLCVFSTGCQRLPKFSRLKMPNFSQMHVPSFGEIAHEFKPHRLHRWNRHTPPNTTSQWSIDDPIPKLDANLKGPSGSWQFPAARNQQPCYSATGLSGLISAAAP